MFHQKSICCELELLVVVGWLFVFFGSFSEVFLGCIFESWMMLRNSPTFGTFTSSFGPIVSQQGAKSQKKTKRRCSASSLKHKSGNHPLLNILNVEHPTLDKKDECFTHGCKNCKPQCIYLLNWWYNFSHNSCPNLSTMSPFQGFRLPANLSSPSTLWRRSWC